MAVAEKAKNRYPIFDLYTIDELGDRTGYSLAYLVSVKDGGHTINRRFRALCAKFLRRPEEELFGKVEAVP